ncbi:MAG: restriction endonuclease subunit S [Phycisphaerales bacterium]|nr:restriction endonuclease subunit S [Phycisphaerales bacterium]
MSDTPLPTGWCVVPLADVLDRLHDGRTLHHGWSPQCEAEPSTDDAIWGVLKTTAVQHGQYLEQHNKLLPSKLRPRANLEVKAGDILMTCAGPRVRCGVPCLVRATRPRLILSGKMYRFRVRPDLVEPRFMEAYLQAPPIQAQIDAMKTGISDSGLNLTHERFHHLNVRIPPLAEQTRIADRIDELFTDLAAGVAALERVKRNLSRYRAAVLHAAVTGRLTESWRKQHGTPDEPGPKLLERILAERRRQWERRTLAKYEKDGKQPPKGWRSRYPEPFLPGTLAHSTVLPGLPDTWCWATHDQVGDVQLGRQRAPEHHTGTHMRPYLRVANVYEDRIDTSDVLQMNFTPEEFETYELRHGDILLNEGQSMELVGRPAMYRDELPGGCFQNTLVRQRAIAPLVPEYALIVCLAQFRAGRFRKIASITTSIAHLGAQRFAALEFPLPPIAEQEAIIDIVKEKLSLIDALTLEVQRGLARAARLRQAILKAAFEGKLVQQDPNDEPAGVLLARLGSGPENHAAGTDSRRKRPLERTKAAR